VLFRSQIQALFDKMAAYPDNPETKAVFVHAILNRYDAQIRDEYDTNLLEVLANGDFIKTKFGSYDLQGTTVASYLNTTLMRRDLCSGKPSQLKLQTSAVKKYYSCDPGPSGALYQAGMAAQEPAEVWYLVTYESIDGPMVNCSGYRTDAQKYFSYQYSGQFREIYTIKDSLTGKVLDSKTFYSSAPRCVFTRCTLNAFDNTATCTGGEAESKVDPEALKKWLLSKVK
jgi:hypothetical protein